MKRFTSSLDSTASGTPYFMIVLALVIFLVGFYFYRKSDAEPIFFYVTILPVTLLLIGIVVAMYYLKPVALLLDTTSVTIERKSNPVTIAYANIKSVTLADKSDMKNTIRTFGNGGVFGYTGKYYNRKLGSMTWYCTQRRNYVLIVKNDDKKIVVTPDDPQGFLQELKSISGISVVPTKL